MASCASGKGGVNSVREARIYCILTSGVALPHSFSSR